MEEFLWSFFAQFENYRTLPVPAQKYFKYCFSQIVTQDSLLQQQENLINLATGKVFLLPYLIRGITGSYGSTMKLKIIKQKTETGSGRSSFRPSFPN